MSYRPSLKLRAIKMHQWYCKVSLKHTVHKKHIKRKRKHIFRLHSECVSSRASALARLSVRLQVRASLERSADLSAAVSLQGDRRPSPAVSHMLPRQATVMDSRGLTSAVPPHHQGLRHSLGFGQRGKYLS